MTLVLSNHGFSLLGCSIGIETIILNFYLFCPVVFAGKSKKQKETNRYGRAAGRMRGRPCLRALRLRKEAPRRRGGAEGVPVMGGGPFLDT